MREINQKYENIIEEKDFWIFLAGAGCSVEPPSLLPDANSMIEQLVKFYTPSAEHEHILSLEALRLENILEIIRTQCDKNIHFLDFFEYRYIPNNIHYYLAEKMREGCPVLTTNFDFLIEHALLRTGVAKEAINLAITVQDYRELENEIGKIKNPAPLLCKLHGSTKNILTGQSTKNYQKEVIKDIGSSKQESSLLLKHPYKSFIFTSLPVEKNLVILGYSGENDYDILPTLLTLTNLQTLMWVNHIDSENRPEDTFEITYQEDMELDNGIIDSFLLNLKQNSPDTNIFKINANIPNLIGNHSQKDSLSTKNRRQTSYFEWLLKNVKKPEKITQYLICHIVYFNFDRYDDALRCGVRVLEQLEKNEDPEKEYIVRNNLGWINYTRGNHSEAITHFERVIDLLDAQNNTHDKIIYWNNIGEIYEKTKNFQKALEYYQNVVNTTHNSVKLTEKLKAINSIVQIYEELGKKDSAIEYYEKAIRLADKMEDMDLKSIYLNNTASLYYEQEKFDLSIDLFEKSQKLLRKLNKPKKLALILNNIGNLYQKTGVYSKALTYFEEALQIDEDINNARGKAIRLNKIGEINNLKGKYSDALDYFKNSLQISGKVKEESLKLKIYKNIGTTHFHLKNYGEALVAFRLGLALSEKLENLEMKADFLNNIAGSHYMQLNFQEAYDKAKEALQALRLSGGGKTVKSIQLEKRINEIESHLDES
ncbi:MAG: tetratricopeptide repeat protein [Promethearchaeia archaeon]